MDRTCVLPVPADADSQTCACGSLAAACAPFNRGRVASSVPAIPFVPAHQLVIFGIRRIFRHQLRSERRIAGQPRAGSVDEIADRDRGEFGRDDLVALALGIHRRLDIAELILLLAERPIFEAARLALHLLKAAPLRDRAEQPELQAIPRAHRGGGGRLASLVIHDRERAVRQPIDAVVPARQRHAGDRHMTLAFRRGDRASFRVLRRHGVGDPAHRLHQPRSPQGAHHRMRPLVLQHRGGARDERVGRATVLLPPLLQDVVDRSAAPRRAGIGIDRVERHQPQHPACVKGIAFGRSAGPGIGSGRTTGRC
ncbi:hypothetical protein WR25_02901 [Diploscapter pachys]|uniref:Uncharacterized protein n=1 Tax=Diploscapter pachys TaxID=2018661 RepID=A0A2A2M3L6_9BILA|nr:hypothetical protein WR25_02901 [Diploscapter pachys]